MDNVNDNNSFSIRLDNINQSIEQAPFHSSITPRMQKREKLGRRKKPKKKTPRNRDARHATRKQQELKYHSGNNSSDVDYGELSIYSQNHQAQSMSVHPQIIKGAFDTMKNQSYAQSPKQKEIENKQHHPNDNRRQDSIVFQNSS